MRKKIYGEESSPRAPGKANAVVTSYSQPGSKIPPTSAKWESMRHHTRLQLTYRRAATETLLLKHSSSSEARA